MRSVRRCATLVLLTSVVALAGCTASHAERIRDPDRHYALIHFRLVDHELSLVAVADEPSRIEWFRAADVFVEHDDGSETRPYGDPAERRVEPLGRADVESFRQVLRAVRRPGMTPVVKWRGHTVLARIDDLDLPVP